MITKRTIPILEKDVGDLTFGMFLRVGRGQLEMSQAEMARKLTKRESPQKAHIA